MKLALIRFLPYNDISSRLYQAQRLTLLPKNLCRSNFQDTFLNHVRISRLMVPCLLLCHSLPVWRTSCLLVDIPIYFGIPMFSDGTCRVGTRGIGCYFGFTCSGYTYTLNLESQHDYGSQICRDRHLSPRLVVGIKL